MYNKNWVPELNIYRQRREKSRNSESSEAQHSESSAHCAGLTGAFFFFGISYSDRRMMNKHQDVRKSHVSGCSVTKMPLGPLLQVVIACWRQISSLQTVREKRSHMEAQQRQLNVILSISVGVLNKVFASSVLHTNIHFLSPTFHHRLQSLL